MTQNLIVNHLNGIEQLQCIAKDMLSKYDELIQSRFVEMFTPFEGNSIMVPLDEVGDIQTGATPSRENADYYQGEIPWVKTGEVQYGIICKTGENITEQALRDTNCKLFPAGTVVVAMYGQGDTRGKAAILGVEAATNQACAAIILDRSICNPTFLLTQLKLRYEDLRGKSVGATQKNLSLKIIREFPILLPPLPLQQQFAAFAEQINRMKEKAAKTLEQLQTLYDSLAQEYFAG